MSGRLVVVHPTPEVLAAAAAARLVTALAEAQTRRGHAHVVLTGGGIGIGTLEAVAASPARDAVNWSAVDVWWGDERYLPDGDAERNETGARAALLDGLPLDPERVHAMPAGDPAADDVAAAAAGYARQLAAAAGGAAVPAFDVLMLGMGPDGHVASLFPGHPALSVQDRSVVDVAGSPKPPPTRVSLTFPAIRAARQVWLIAAGAGKAAVCARALGGATEAEIPAAGVYGTEATLWLLDAAAAADLPATADGRVVSG